jgi:hypothetical protein
MIQCPQQYRCVKIGVLADGNTPICRSEECISGFANMSAGVCQKTLEQARKEEIELKTIRNENLTNGFKNFSAGVVLLIIGFFLFRKGSIELKHKKIANKIKKLNDEIKEKELLLRAVDKQTADNAEQIARKTAEVTKLRKELQAEQEKERAIRARPFVNKQGRKVIINENGYEVFPDSLKPFHRWWFEHNHKKKIQPYNEIHHINFDKRDNRIENLVELSHDEHMQRHRDKFG